MYLIQVVTDNSEQITSRFVVK
ncbi:hypothetical protein KFE98_12355 [bacterium SCSIO 12741]|nr:hypothetical protein KFE98_12355 [bacterium SCSIO 12741]